MSTSATPKTKRSGPGFLRSLKKRGLSGVRLVISDAHEGLKAAIRRCLQGSSWQRCRVHYIRNLLATIPKAHTEMVAAVFRSIFTQATAAEVEARWDEVTDTLDGHGFTKAADSMRSAKHDVLAFTAVPESALAQDLVEQPARTVEQRDQTPDRTSLGSSPTTPPSSASSAPSWPTNTTNGPSPAAMSPKHPSPNSTTPAILTFKPHSRPDTEHQPLTKSPPLHGTQSSRPVPLPGRRWARDRLMSYRFGSIRN